MCILFNRLRWFFILFLASWGCMASTEVFKATDAQGVVQYSDRPSAQAEVINIPSSAKDPALEQRVDHLHKYMKARGEEAEDRKAAAKERKKKEEERKKKCEEATVRYENTSTARYLYTRDKQGNRDVLDFAERDQRVAELKKAMDQICNRRDK